jgi:hypothetical protein
MRKFLTFLVALAMVILAAPPNLVLAQSQNRNLRSRTSASPTKFHKVKNAAPGQYIVMLRKDTPRSQVSPLASALTRTHGGAIEYIYTDIFKGFSVQNMSEAQARMLSLHPQVTSVEESARVQVTGQQFWPEETGVIKPLDRIDQRSGLDAFYNYPRTGTGVHVYIVDTGVWIQHNEFGGRAYALWDFQPSTSIGGYATGADNHGTLTASAVGSKTYGVAKNCLLYSVRVVNFANGTGTTSNIIQGLQQVLNDVVSKNKKPAVVNMSVVVSKFDSQVGSLETAVTNLINNGITVVTGAGNGNNDASNFSPGRLPRVITVGATTGIPGPSLDAKASYSSFGSVVDVYAPGGDSNWFARNAGHNTTYGIDGNQGTSIASPLGAGAVALYLEQFSLDPGNFNAQPDQVQSAIKNNKSGQILYMGCEFISPPDSNPIDNTRIFIRQHYYDFLNRQPDQSGWDFWAGTIDSCNGDQQCIQVKRINGSKAFFESIEFLGTGYYVYRVNKISFLTFTREGGQFVGPNPRMEQFFVDQQKVGSGVIVGQSGWEQVLDTNQTNYANEWVNRPRFLSEYPTSMSNAAFVDKLYTTAGVSDPATRDAMVNGLNNGTETRATVVKKVAASSAVASNQQLFYNPAYVLMQYFGYLRRNPDDAPDSDLSGYNFWLNQLNNGTKTTFDMVNAFISSTEYRERFFKGPFCTAEPPQPPPPEDPPSCCGNPWQMD